MGKGKVDIAVSYAARDFLIVDYQGHDPHQSADVFFKGTALLRRKTQGIMGEEMSVAFLDVGVAMHARERQVKWR